VPSETVAASEQKNIAHMADEKCNWALLNALLLRLMPNRGQSRFLP
jgi:hypothetical protein